jgi:integrase
MQTKITKTAVEALTPGQAIWDDKLKGFGARRQKEGTFYYVRYRLNGTAFMKSLGRHGHLTPDQARKIAKTKLGLTAQGLDPFEDATKLRSSEVLGTALERYLARRSKVMKPRAFLEVHRHLMGHAKRFHRLRLSEVTQGKIAELLHDVEERSGPANRNRVRSSLSAFFNWTITEGLLEASPVTGTAKADEGGPRERVLTQAELAEVWAALPQDQFGDIVRLLILTAQRREEIGSLHWSEVDLDRAVITLPPSRTKNRRQHEIPLSPEASAILKALAPTTTSVVAIRPKREFIFGIGKGGFSGWSDCKARLDARIAQQRKEAGAKPMASWRLHDLRRTAATLMAEKLGILPHIIEAVLNHVSGAKSGIAGVYNRATYANDMRNALCKWADYLDEITSPARQKVVSVRTIPHEGAEGPRATFAERLSRVPRSTKS